MSAESRHLNVTVPNGLCDLLRDITNEAIRCQPHNLCEFIADYLQLREFMARDKFVRTRNEVIVSILSPEFVGTVGQIFKSCDVERVWRCYCVNRLLAEFDRLEKLLIKGDTVYEMILNNRVPSVIMDEEKLISDAVHRCKLSEREISSLRQTNRLCLDRFLHKLLNDGRRRATLTHQYDYEIVDELLNKIIDFTAAHRRSAISANFRENFPTVHRIHSAAVKIQSHYRGHVARKQQKLRKEEENAALCIQLAFRRHLAARKGN